MRFSSKPAIFSTTGSWGFYYYGYRFYDPGMQRWLNRDPLGEEGGLNLTVVVNNNPLLYIDATGLGTWKVTAVDIDLDDPKYNAKTALYSNAKGFQVTYIPGANECPNGRIILFQIKGIVGTTFLTSYKPHVDGGIPNETCKLPPKMWPSGSDQYSYIDSPSTEGAETHTMTAVAVCRSECKDKTLSTYYFEFSQKGRKLDTSNAKDTSHYKKGMEEWSKKGGAQ
jgi:RHS repeat-associated protein